MKFDLITEDYKQLLTDKHATKPWGGGGEYWAPLVATLVNEYESGVRILDYGCGRRTFAPVMQQLLPDAVITEYDPGVPGLDHPPTEPVDFVVCTDVLEHIEPEKLNNVLGHIDWLARHGVLFNIVFGPSRSLLPDGRNTHLLQRSHEWWWEKLNDGSFPLVDWIIHDDASKPGTRLIVSGKRTWDGGV
jgi:hypothetical protein